jgi:nucleoid-associated protein YgaU
MPRGNPWIAHLLIRAVLVGGVVCAVAGGGIAWYMAAHPDGEAGPEADRTALAAPPPPVPGSPASPAPAPPATQAQAIGAPAIGAPATEAPAATSAPSPAAAPPAPDRPQFDVVRVAPDGSAIIAGRAAPGAEVTVHDGTQEVGRVTADAQGSFVMIPDTKLPSGAQELTLAERGQDGQVTQSDTSVTLVVPDEKLAAAAEPAAPLAVLTPDSGPSRVLQAPPGMGAKAKLGLDVVDYDDHGNIAFAGSAPPGAPVRVYVDDKPAGDARADPQGRWTLTPEVPVADGLHRLRVDQLSPTGRVIARVELPFERQVGAAQALADGHVVVQPGQNLWRLARKAYGSGVRYTVIYQANRDQIRDPRLIYPGQAFAVPPEPGVTPVSSRRSR